MINKSKFVLLASFIFILLSGCRNESTENQDETVENEIIIESEPEIETEAPTIALPYIVTFDENTGRLEINKNPESTSTSYTAEQVAEALNTKYPEIFLRVGELKQDTLDLHVDDATHLSQGMG